MTLLLVGGCGFFGAVARYTLDGWAALVTGGLIALDPVEYRQVTEKPAR